MVKQPHIDDVLDIVLRNPKNTTDFLLGTICNDVCTIKDRQEKIDRKIDESTVSLEKKIAAIQLEVDEIRETHTFNRGFLAAIAAVGGSLGVGITYLFKFIISGFAVH